MFKDYKILVDNEDESKEVQEALFKLGYKWCNGNVTPMHTSYKVLTTYADGCICFGVSKSLFEDHENEELTLSQLKSMVEIEESKFRVGDEVEIVKLDKTIKHFGGEGVLSPVGTKTFVTYVDVTGEEVEIDEDIYSYHASDLVLVNDKEETQAYNPLIAQEGGGHYKDRGIQPLEYTMQNNLSFCEGNVVKYISRYKSKNGIEDLAKVIHYALLSAYEEYGEQGSTELKEKVLKLLGEHG